MALDLVNAETYATNMPSLFRFILSNPVAAKWLLDRRPLVTIPASALSQSVGFKVKIVPLEKGTQAPSDYNVLSTRSFGESYEAGTNFLITPMFEDGSLACGAFFGDQAPPVAGGWSKPVACSRWAADMRYNVLFQCAWFNDGSLSCMVFRFDHNWTKEVYLFRPFPEGQMPGEALVRGRLYDRRDCGACQENVINCVHLPVPANLDGLYNQTIESYPGGSMSPAGFCGNFVSSRTGQFTTVAAFQTDEGYTWSLLHNQGIRFNEMEEEINRSNQIKEAGYNQPESVQSLGFQYVPSTVENDTQSSSSNTKVSE